MFYLSGYTIKEPPNGGSLYQSNRSVVYRAKRESDGLPVILKWLKNEYPTPKEISCIKREYKMTKAFGEEEGIIRAEGLEQSGNTWVMILEDFGGEALSTFIEDKPLGLELFLSLAIRITESLGLIHQHQIMHKDINPDNIVWNPATDQLKIIDFGISTELSQEQPEVLNPHILEGTLSYMSPEQTGRMNRAMDYRTDLYSLGATFYRMLAPHPPFEAEDAIELVHCHIAKQPQVLHKMNWDAERPKIPEVISDIILKLMTKAPEERYQTTLGLQADLQTCLDQLQSKDIIDSFPLGQKDISDRFEIPQKLYGRKQEIQFLINTFEKAVQGSSEMLLVSGYSGIGKSALVHEIHKPIVIRRGYFISGKFDQFQRNIPYSALIHALQELIRQLLAEPAKRLELWKIRLLQALGKNGQVMIEVIPEIEKIIGVQPSVPQLGSQETQNRFNLTLIKFLQVFTRPDHPLVMFLDDLQWVDAATLNLLQVLITNPDLKYLLIIGAYRNHEAGSGPLPPTHPLIMTVEQIKKENVAIHTLSLKSLGKQTLTQLLSDALYTSPKDVLPLADLLLKKTEGNPFFVNEFLKTLYQRQLIAFDRNQGRWVWDIKEIEEENLTDNVIDLMIGKLQQLPTATRRVMSWGAAMGNRFAIPILSIIYGKSLHQTAVDLWPAVRVGLLQPMSEAHQLFQKGEETIYTQALSAQFELLGQFAHDRIQQASYALIEEGQQKQLHLKIGRLLLKQLSDEAKDRGSGLDASNLLEERLFEIVGQFNEGRSLIDTLQEKQTIARLNLRAGKKAKASVAYESAFNYLKTSLELLGEDSWEREYQLTLEIYAEAAEVAYLNLHYDWMEQLIEQVLAHAKTILDQVKVYEIKIRAYGMQKKQHEAIKMALSLLRLLGVHLPDGPEEKHIRLAREEIQELLKGKSIESLSNLKEMEHAEHLAAMQIMARCIPLTYQVSPLLFPLTVLKMLQLTLQDGACPESALAYATYGMVLAGMFEDVDSGYRFGKQALHVIERFNAKQLMALNAVWNFLTPWKEHLHNSLIPLQEIYQKALEVGDFQAAAVIVQNFCHNKFHLGENLQEVGQEMEINLHTVRQLKQIIPLNYLNIGRQCVLNLTGHSVSPVQFIGEAYDETTKFPLDKKGHDLISVSMVYFNKMWLCYLFEEYEESFENAQHTEVCHQKGILAHYIKAKFYFYDSLIRLALFNNTPALEHPSLLKKVTTNQEKVKHWAHHAPMNYLHNWQLVEAEQARVLGKEKEAKSWYQKAIQGAHDNEYLQEEALANELYAKFWLGQDDSEIAQLYLKKAHYLYTKWGATAKVKDLEEKYQDLLANRRGEISHQMEDKMSTFSSSSDHLGDQLDFTTIVKAAQVISGEIQLSALLKTLMRLALENSGAQKGFFILNTEDQLRIEAAGQVESQVVTVMQSIPLDSLSEENARLPLSLIRYVEQTRQELVLDHASQDRQFAQDSYILHFKPQSVLCTPILHQGKLSGILYLENNLVSGVFTPKRLEVLNLLSAQAAISIENAKLYEQQQSSLVREQELSRLKDEFLTRTSHELRTPLHGMIGMAEGLMGDQQAPLSGKQQQDLSIMISSGRRLSHLIDDILDFSLLKHQDLQLNLQPVSVRDIVKLVFRSVQTLVREKSLELINTIPLNFPLAEADENRLQQILYNLIGNAIKFTPQGLIEVGGHQAHDLLVIVVKDTGIGIAPHQLERIFNPFEQAAESSKAYDGVGLGLTVTKQLVELHSGQLTVVSEEGTGSSFTFTLPISKQQSPLSKDSLFIDENVHSTSIRLSNEDVSPEAAFPLLQLSVPDAQYHILAVDDDPINLQVIVNHLRSLNENVTTAINGLEALEVLEQEWPIDLIILDVMMPQMNGYETCHKIRERFSREELPIILLTAKNQTRDVVEGLCAGANDYLTKPFHKEELLARIDGLLQLKTNTRLKEEIQQRQQVESQLLATQQHLVAILNTLDEAVLAFTHEGRITFFNQQAEALFGYTLDELLNQSMQHLIPEWEDALDFALLSLHQKDAENTIVLKQKLQLTVHHKNKSLLPLDADVLLLQTPEEHFFVMSIARSSSPTLFNYETRFQQLENLLKELLPALTQENQAFFQKLRETPRFPNMPEGFPQLITPHPEMRQTVVELVSLSIQYWIKATQKTKEAFAEESGLWSVHLEKRGVYRARNLERYSSLKTLPKNPRVKTVLQTAEYVLNTCPEVPQLKTRLETSLAQLKKYSQ